MRLRPHSNAQWKTEVDCLRFRFADDGEKNYILAVLVASSRTENLMPRTPHIERHFTAGDTVRDIVIGMSDGLTVPFALAAGLSGAVIASRVIVTAALGAGAAGALAPRFGVPPPRPPPSPPHAQRARPPD